jgi:ATP-binding protein involved in chromosome partitioning
MSSFRCEHGTEHALFGTGGGETLANDAGIPLLGKVPIEAAVSAGGDIGEPAVLGSGPAAEAFTAIADRIVSEAIPQPELAGCSARMLDAAMAAFDDLDAAAAAEG